MLNPLEDSDWEPRPQKKRSAWPFLLVAALLGFAAYRSGGVQAKLNAMVDRFYAKGARSLIQEVTARAKQLRAKAGSLDPKTDTEDETAGGTVEVAPASEPAKVWNIRVNAYDLRALKPVKGLSVRLRGGGKTYAPRVKGGVFEFEVPRLAEDGYHLELRRRKQPARFIEDIAAVPYRDHDAERRDRDIEDLSGERILHAPVRAEDASGRLELPIAVLP